MSRLDELIAELCPDGVEFKELREICHALKKSTLKTSDLIENGKYPVINSGRDLYGFYDCYNNKNAITFAARGEYAGFISYFENEFWAGGLCYPYSSYDESVVENKYIYYFLKSIENRIMNTLVAKGSIPALNKSDVDKIKVPVPPLEVQREIVRVLDSFTLLTAELTAELTARKKQYEFYRDELLSVKENIPLVKLEDIAIDFYRGSGIRRDEVTEEGIPCVRYGEIYTTYNTWFDKCVSHTNLKCVKTPKYFEYGDILFVITGESVEDIAKSVAYVGHDKCLAGGDIVVMKHNQNPRYLAHVLATTEAKLQKGKGKVKSKVVHSNVQSIKEIKIPLPSLEAQERYANILDRFDTLCNDLSSGLPAEIEARQKQYEYYRDKLLSFEEKQ